MIVLVVFGLVMVVGILLRRRAARKRTLAGLDATRPAYSVAPPVGRLSSLKGERL